MKLNNQPNANNGANGQVYSAIEKWYDPNLAFNGDPFSWTKQSKAFGAKIIGSTDHVWEKYNLVRFLSSLLGNDFDGDDLNKLFFDSCTGTNRLQQIFN